MSSQKSRRVPTPTEHRQALCDALVDVSEHSFFAVAEVGDEPRFAELVSNPVPALMPWEEGAADAGVAPAPVSWLVVHVRFTGAWGGALVMTLPRPLAGELLASFLGRFGPEDLSEDELLDGTGELANMTCGDWLTRTCERRRFDLQPPAVEVMPEGWSPLEASSAWQVFAAINDRPVALRLEFHEAV